MCEKTTTNVWVKCNFDKSDLLRITELKLIGLLSACDFLKSFYHSCLLAFFVGPFSQLIDFVVLYSFLELFLHINDFIFDPYDDGSQICILILRFIDSTATGYLFL